MAAFEAAQSYFSRQFGVVVDPACSDVSRLCFVSHDPALFFNAVAQELEVPNSSPQAVRETGSATPRSDVRRRLYPTYHPRMKRSGSALH